jgi:AcrR family transcriptional regulator
MIDVYLEVAKRRTFACAVDWPGWCRSGKDADAALEALAAYADRYRAVVPKLPKRIELAVVEELAGDATTDFGAPSKACSLDERPLTAAQARTIADVVAASWQALDRVAAGAPTTLRKGPRGGGRDRDAIVQHVADADAAYFRSVGLRQASREDFLDALRAARRPRSDGKWLWRYAARRIAWHALDHAWEIEDKS